ncbi:MAG: Mut7-C RNAse domain-containing protein [Thermoplasmata archaeon]
MTDSDAPAPLPTAPRWLADAMLGRLARYLRFLGHDTAYVRGEDDASVARRAREEGRTLLTRDRALAKSVDGSLLLESPDLSDQLREVHRAYPQAGWSVAFVRCSLCNARLVPWAAPPPDAWPDEVPRDLVQRGLEIFQCPACGQRYWEGSHTRRIRRQVEQWVGPMAP